MGRLLIGLVVVCAGVLSAQDASDYFESMRLGEAALAEKKPNHNGAHTHFRDAAFTAQAMGRARFEAMALHELAQLHERDTWAERRKDAPPALLDRAEKLAQEASNPALQARILVSAAVYGDTTAWARALDIAAAQSDLWVLERGYMLAKTDEQKALWRKAADLHDRLHFMWRHNDEPDLDGLAALIKEATEAKLPLFAWRVDIYRAAKAKDLKRQAALVDALSNDRQWALLQELFRYYPEFKGSEYHAAVVKAVRKMAAAESLTTRFAATKLLVNLGVEGLDEKLLALFQQPRNEASMLALAAESDPSKLGSHQREYLTEFRDMYNVSVLFDLLEPKAGPAPTKEETEAYAKAFKAALKDAEKPRLAFLMTEVSGRRDMAPTIAEDLKEIPSLWGARAFETLADKDDTDQVREFLQSKDKHTFEAAAAAWFRINPDVAIDDIKKSLGRNAFKDAAPWIGAWLAKNGDVRAGKNVRAMAATEKDSELKVHANGAMAALGYAAPIARLHDLAAQPKYASTVSRVMGRTPRTWGAEVLYKAADNSGVGISASRALFVRDDPHRDTRMSSKAPYPEDLAYRSRSNGEANPFRTLRRVKDLQDERFKDGYRDLANWMAERAGLDAANFGNDLRREGGGPLANLARTERDQANDPVSSVQRTKTLTVDSEHGYATFMMNFEVGTADVVNNKLRIPLHFRDSKSAMGFGIGGVIWTQVTLAIAATSVVKTGIVRLASGAERKCTVSVTGNSIVAETVLPTREGADGETELMPLRILEGATLVLSLQFDAAKDDVEFPVRLNIPTDATKPDLYPVSVSLDPPAPDADTPVKLVAAIRNRGLTITDDTPMTIRFFVRNAQHEEGYRTLRVMIDSAKGWRSGAIRTYRMSSRIAGEWYMNKFVHTWTPEIGDTKLGVTIDATNVIDEDDEDNNTLEVASGLDLPEDAAAEAAEKALAEALAPLLEEVKNAKDPDELLEVWGRVEDLFKSSRVKTKTMRAVEQQTNFSINQKFARLEAEEAIQQLKDAYADGKKPSRETLYAIQRKMARSQQALMETGVPVKTADLQDFHNVVKTMGNLSDSHQKFGDLAGLFGRDIGSPPGKTTETLKALDAAIHAVKFARGLRDGKPVAGEYLDMMSGVADATGLAAPALGSNVAKEMFGKQVDYGTQGMRKNASAIEAMTEYMNNPTEENRRKMLEASEAAGDHIKKGPYNERDFMKAVFKDLGPLGPIFDSIFSIE